VTEALERIHPIVLVGGQSRRFGRDKLREPWKGSLGGEWLIDQPIRALRQVFGSRVRLVGNCHPSLLARADSHTPDRYPGAGPLGGIITALEAAAGDIFVLAGDLAHITPAEVRAVVEGALAEPDRQAAVACASELEPCIGLYRLSALGALIDQLARGELAVHRALARLSFLQVSIAPEAAQNANRVQDLAREGR
jgi:molybdopterin-guanine dinucleotide biosynthesis protein A